MFVQPSWRLLLRLCKMHVALFILISKQGSCCVLFDLLLQSDMVVPGLNDLSSICGDEGIGIFIVEALVKM